MKTTIQRAVRAAHLVLATGLAFGAMQCAYAVEAPSLLGQLALDGSPAFLRVTPDGSRALLQVQASSSRPAEVHVIDVSDPSHPVARDRISTRGAGELALAEDGRSALVAEVVKDGRRAAPSTYKVTLFDLGTPGKPRARWERTVDASAMALAPDASAFAYTPGAAFNAGRDEVLLVLANGNETRLSLPRVNSFGHIHISRGARFVAVDDYGWTLDEVAHPSVAFKRDRSGSNPEGCVLAVLPDGHLLVEDLRAPRFGVYAPRNQLPRIAMLAHGAPAGSSCQFALVGQAGKLLLMRHANGTLQTVDMSDALHPRLSKPLLLPQGSYAAGVDAKGRLYALRGRPNEGRLEIYDMTQTAPPSVDWAALERVRIEALQTYGDKSLAEFQRRWDAARKFEDTGALAALSAPVAGVSNVTAARILNDYAFLIQRSRLPGDPDVLALLRRAIELDPSRRVAYLNLADALRQALPVEPGPRQKLLAEARASYGKYLAQGGAPVKELQILMEDRLYRRPPGEVCRAIVDFTNAGRLGELIHATAIGVAAGGRKLDLVFTTEGTGHVPAFYAWDEADDSPVEDVAAPGGDQLWGGDELGLAVYGGAAHVLHFRDDAHPVASVALSGGQFCEFSTTTVEHAANDAMEPELCARLDGDSAPADLEFTESASITEENVAQVYGETALDGARKIDLSNDGHPITVGRLGLSSGAGAGCEETFFDVLDANGAQFQPGPRRDQLMALQGADPSNRYPMLPCGNKARFFSYKGSVYFENKPSQWPPIDRWNSYHRVARVRKGKVEDVCHFSFKTTVTLTREEAR